MPARITHFCVECNRSFRGGFWQFQQHVREFHLNWYPFYCQYCRIDFSSGMLAYNHVLEYHPVFLTTGTQVCIILFMYCK